MPGGDNIGSRKLDMHFRGLEALGAELEVVHGFIEARCNALCGARVVLEFPSVGATENAAHGSRARQGRDRHRERGARARDQRPRGVPHQDGRADRGRRHVHARDRRRRRAARRSTTRSSATASRRGPTLRVRCRRRRRHRRGDRPRAPRDGRRASSREMGVEVSRDARRRARARPTTALHAVDVADPAVPGFATDFMPLAVALLATADGTAHRDREHLRQPLRVRRRAPPHGRRRPHRGSPRRRAGRAPPLRRARPRPRRPRPEPRSVLAGLAADGETVVLEPHHVDRGLPRPGRQAPGRSAPTSSAVDGPSEREREAGNTGLRYWGCHRRTLRCRRHSRET